MTDDNLLHPGKVLVMDDDELLRSTARLMLVRLGYDAVLAANGDEAVFLYRQHLESDYPVDVAILDLKVPDGVGALELAPMIRELDPAARLVVASGSVEDPAMVDCHAHGFQAALCKPFVIAQVGMLIGELLD
jgi:CheY-like chemotaxis protein